MAKECVIPDAGIRCGVAAHVNVLGHAVAGADNHGRKNDWK